MSNSVESSCRTARLYGTGGTAASHENSPGLVLFAEQDYIDQQGLRNIQYNLRTTYHSVPPNNAQHVVWEHQTQCAADNACPSGFSPASNVVNSFDDRLAGFTIAVNSTQTFYYGDSKTHPWQVAQIFRRFIQSNSLSCYIQLKKPEINLSESAPGAPILTFGFASPYMAPNESGTPPAKNSSIDSTVDYPKGCSANVP